MNSGGRECVSTGHTKQGIVAYVGPSLHHNSVRACRQIKTQEAEL